MSARRYILAIETSNPSAGGAGVAIARLEGGAVVGAVGVEALAEGGRGGDDLLPAIDRATRRIGATPGELARVAVSVGPGGYTGLRLAVTAARVIAEATGAEVAGVPTAEVAAAALGSGDPPALICLASKGERSWAALATDAGVRPLGVIGPGDLGALGARTIAHDGHLAPAIGARAAALGVRPVPLTLDPAACARLGAAALACDPDGLAPIYAREPDAVTQWRARHG